MSYTVYDAERVCPESCRERPENCSLVDINLVGVATNLADWALAQSTRDAYRPAARSFDKWRCGVPETDAALAARCSTGALRSPPPMLRSPP